MKNFITIILLGALFFIIFGCSFSTDKVMDTATNIKQESYKVINPCYQLDASGKPNCFTSGNAQKQAIKDQAYQQCIAQYQQAIQNNWGIMTKTERLIAGLKMIESCEQ